MRITAIAITVVEIPQTPLIAPYRSHVRSSSTTRSAIVRLDTDAGLVGWGEYNVNFLPGISASRAQAEAAAWLIGRDALCSRAPLQRVENGPLTGAEESLVRAINCLAAEPTLREENTTLPPPRP